MFTSVLSVRLEDDLKGRLDRLSSDTGRPVAFYVREAVVEYLDELEYAFTLRSEVEQYRSGARELGSWDDVKARLDLD